MYIQDVHISDYKSISELEVETNRINIITGRNNSGKTSFLESIDLLFNPDQVERYGENISDLIRVNQKSASLSAKFSQQQKSLADYQEGIEYSNRDIGIRRPNKTELTDAFFDILYSIVEMNESYPIRLEPDLHNYIQSGDFTESLDEQIKSILLDTISEVPEEYVISNIRGNGVVFEIDGETYHRIYFGKDYHEMRSDIETQAVDQFLIQFTNTADFDETDLNRVRENIKSNFHRLLAPRFARGRFVGDSPSPIPGVKFLQNPKDVKERVDMSKENSAVIVDNIEDYMRKNNIVENLNDFSFNKLVFSEEDKKQEIPYDFMGDGFKSIVGILWEIYSEQSENSVLLLEEPGIHMHPGYINKLVLQLIKMSSQKSLQMFITTHSSDFIDAFFSNPIQERWGEYLQEQFKLLQMTEPVSQTFDYAEADDTINDLHLDLRGI